LQDNTFQTRDGVASKVPHGVHAKLVAAVVESGTATLGCEAIDEEQAGIAVANVLDVLAAACLLRVARAQTSTDAGASAKGQCRSGREAEIIRLQTMIEHLERCECCVPAGKCTAYAALALSKLGASAP
jgi:hypothetical protein